MIESEFPTFEMGMDKLAQWLDRSIEIIAAGMAASS
jgi:hypothetical protein